MAVDQHKPAKRRAPVALVIITICVVLLTAGIWYIFRGRYLFYPVEQHLPLNYSSRGISVDVVEPQDVPWGPHIMPAPTRVRILTPDRIAWLRSLNDLRGLVRIQSGAEALAYVRWGTDHSFYYAGASNAMEVQSVTQANQGAYSAGRPSGAMAILNDADFKRDGFALPVVTAVGSTYHIVRWVCVFDDLDGKRVQLRDETVGADGSYSSKVLMDKPLPVKHGETWFVYGLM